MHRKHLKTSWAVAALLTAATSFAVPMSSFASDDNPPGPAGGRGTNWENPPGAIGGPGTSPDRVYYGQPFKPVQNGYYYSAQRGYYYPGRGLWVQSSKCWWDRDGNPPGPAGGSGTNWENPPGYAGGPGASPDKYGRCK